MSVILAAASTGLPAQAQQEVNLEMVTICGEPMGEDTMIWLRLATITVLVWKLTESVRREDWFRRYDKNKRYWWPTLMVGWACLTTLPLHPPVEQPSAVALDLLAYCFFIVNAPALVLVFPIVLLLNRNPDLVRAADWAVVPFFILTLWTAWYALIALLDNRDQSNKPILLGMAGQP